MRTTEQEIEALLHKMGLTTKKDIEKLEEIAVKVADRVMAYFMWAETWNTMNAVIRLFYPYHLSGKWDTHVRLSSHKPDEEIPHASYY